MPGVKANVLGVGTVEGKWHGAGMECDKSSCFSLAPHLSRLIWPTVLGAKPSIVTHTIFGLSHSNTHVKSDE